MKSFAKNILLPMGIGILLLAIWFLCCAIGDPNSGLYVHPHA